MRSIYSDLTRRVRRDGLMLFAGHLFNATRDKAFSLLAARRLGSDGLHLRHDALIKGASHIAIGKNFDAGRGLWLEAIDRYRGQSYSPHLAIGANVSLSSWCHIAAVESVAIGDDVMIGSKVVVIDHNHGCYSGQAEAHVQDTPDTPPAARALWSAPISIGNRVWIGDGVAITAGSTIGDGAIIAANAVVTGHIPANTMAAGAPARPVKAFDPVSRRWEPVRPAVTNAPTDAVDRRPVPARTA